MICGMIYGLTRYNQSHELSLQSISTGPTPSVALIGQFAHVGVLRVQVTDLRIDKTGQTPYLPGVGRVFYITTLKVLNTSNLPHWVTPVTQVHLEDDAHNSYEMSPAPTSQPFEAGPLDPLEARVGEVSFSIPESARDLKLYYMDNKSNRRSAEITLTR